MITWIEFVAEASEVFGFLISDYDFKLGSTEHPFMNYDKPNIRVFLHYNITRRGEIDLCIRRLPVTEQFVPAFRLSQFENLSPTNFPEPRLAEWAVTRTEIQSTLNEMASRLKRYCSKTLQSDFSDLEKLEKIRQTQRQQNFLEP